MRNTPGEREGKDGEERGEGVRINVAKGRWWEMRRREERDKKERRGQTNITI